MATRLISQTEFPITTDQAKFRLRIDETGIPDVDESEDADIEAMLKAATQLAESMTRRAIAVGTYKLTLDAFPSEIRLLHPPIVSVQSIQYVDADGVTQTLNPTAYSVDIESEPGCIIPADDTDWPETKETANAVTVNYTAGWGLATPEAVKQFILLHAGHMYRSREAVTDKPMTALPYGDRMLDSYKLWEV